MAALVLSIIGLVLTVAGYGVQEGMQGWGNSIRGRLTKIANQLYSKIGNNTAYLEKLYQAYQKKDADLGNALLVNAGFGPATIALRKEMEKNRDDYTKERDAKNQENIDLTNKYNQANQAIMNAGQGIAANIGADNVAEQLEQSIQGGMKENA